MSFRAWMQYQGRSLVTAKKYAGALYGTLSRLAGLQISDIDDVETLDVLVTNLKNNPEFVRLDSVGHRMYSCGLNAYRQFLQDSVKDGPVLVAELRDIETDATLTPTERLALTKARLGQGSYRSRLIDRWHGRCSVTGYEDPRLLIASHIKPWYAADNRERLDPSNGLLLTPNLDKAFDLGLISFNPRNRGRIVFSESLVKPLALGLSDTMCLTELTPETARYLTHHMKSVFIKR